MTMIRVETPAADAVPRADVVTGGGSPTRDLPPWFGEPTALVAGETASSRIRREKVFGQVHAVVRIENESDGIRASAEGAQKALLR